MVVGESEIYYGTIERDKRAGEAESTGMLFLGCFAGDVKIHWPCESLDVKERNK